MYTYSRCHRQISITGGSGIARFNCTESSKKLDTSQSPPALPSTLFSIAVQRSPTRKPSLVATPMPNLVSSTSN